MKQCGTNACRKLALKQLSAVVIVILVIAAVCVWLLLRIFLLPSNSASVDRGKLSLYHDIASFMSSSV
jgi:hypothetical protein